MNCIDEEIMKALVIFSPKIAETYSNEVAEDISITISPSWKTFSEKVAEKYWTIFKDHVREVLKGIVKKSINGFSEGIKDLNSKRNYQSKFFFSNKFITNFFKVISKEQPKKFLKFQSNCW